MLRTCFRSTVLTNADIPCSLGSFVAWRYSSSSPAYRRVRWAWRPVREPTIGRERSASQLERRIEAWHRNSDVSMRLAQIPGVGPLKASALVASNVKVFKSPSHLAAWLGLVPRQYSTGGKARLGGISKRGDAYLRTLLIHGARVVLYHNTRRQHGRSPWLDALLSRCHFNAAAVALAHKAYAGRGLRGLPKRLVAAVVSIDLSLGCEGMWLVDGTSGWTEIDPSRRPRGGIALADVVGRRSADPFKAEPEAQYRPDR